jgi:hypothetical protein
MDLAATGDTERTHQAFDDFLTTIDNDGRRSASSLDDPPRPPRQA